MSVLHLSDNQIAHTVQFLQERSRKPRPFANAPVVINVAKVEGDLDYPALKQGISQAGLIPVGVTGCKDKRRQNLAVEAGFAVMTATNFPAQAPAQMAPTKVIRKPVRSGQQIYAKDGDQVILSHVSAGLK